MKRSERLILVSFAFILFLSTTSYAFIPPLTALIQESFEGRSFSSVEYTWRHQIVGDDDKVTEIEEKWVTDRGKALITFRNLKDNQTLMASWEKQNYLFKDKKVPSSCSTFVSYFLSVTGDEFRDAALSEGYLKKDQLLQYQPSFAPSGDPITWKIQDNYWVHDDIFLSRWPHGIFYTFEGTSESNSKKSLLFQREQAMLTGIRSEQNGVIQGWNLSSGSKYPGAGYFPKSMTYDFQGKERVHSELIQVKTVRDRALADVKSNWRNPNERQPLSDSWESFLKVLLAFR
jgi:hypothetical protein